MSVISSEQIVIELCKETGEPGLANNQTIWNCILDGIRDLNLFSMPTWDRVDDLCVNAYNAVDWPDEVVKPLITYLVRNGRALALDVSDSIISTANSANIPVPAANDQIQDFYRIDGYNGNYSIYNIGFGEIYGISSSFSTVGMVTHDKQRRQSFITGGLNLLSDDRVGMFFKTDGLSRGCFVPAECKEALERFALAKYYRTRNPNLGVLNREAYKEESYRVRKFSADEGLEAWIPALEANTITAPKF